MDTQLKDLITVKTGLKQAIKNKDKQTILDLYEMASKFEYVPEHETDWEEYDELVSQANDILYSQK